MAPVAIGAALVGVRDHIQNTNVALILVVVVVAAAAIGGRLAGATAAVVSAVAFIFFHTQPYLRLTIDSANDVETAFLLLVVGLLAGHITAGAMRARVSAAETASRSGGSTRSPSGPLGVRWRPSPRRRSRGTSSPDRAWASGSSPGA